MVSKALHLYCLVLVQLGGGSGGGRGVGGKHPDVTEK